MKPGEEEGVQAPLGEDVVEGENTEDVIAEEAPVPTADEVLAETLEVPDVPAPVATEPGGFPMWGLGLGLVAVVVAGLGVRALTRTTPQIEPTVVAELPASAAPVPESGQEPDESVAIEPEPESLVARFSRALGRSREALQGRFDTLFGRDTIDESLFEELEETLLKADVGFPTTERLLKPLRELASQDAELAELRASLRTQIQDLLLERDPALNPAPAEGPWVLLVVGVNGSGKTTTIGKLAARFRADGKSVLLAAADTYRAAAVEQLKVWADRADVEIVSHDEGSDPGAVVYDALDAAKARGRDVVIVDTAGRLQTARPLMEQLGKIRRVIDKKVPGAPHETLLVLDGTMGQNGLSQAKLFHQATPLTGAVVTKLDGTARGGMVLTLSAELDLPVKFIGIGEGIDDLKPFDAAAFAEALA